MTVALKTLDQIESKSYEESFLIGDLLTTKTTFLTGEPKSGKTLLAVGMVIALVNGHDTFLNQKVYKPIRRVVFGLSDDGAEEELKARLDGAVPPDSVQVFRAHDNREVEYWAEVRDTLRHVQADLFVLDNVLGALGEGEDISSPLVAQKIASNLRLIAGAGVPVLAVTHSPKGAGDGLTVSSSVIGGRAIAAAGRGVVAIRDGERRGKRIQTKINRAHQDLHLTVKVERQSPDSEVPVWRVLEQKAAEDKPRRDRSPASNAQLVQLANHLVENQPDGVRSLAGAGRLGAQFGLSEDTAKRRIKGFASWTGERWERVA